MFSETTLLNARQLFKQHTIKRLDIGVTTGIDKTKVVSDIKVLCTSEAGVDYTVFFKLQEQCADICRYLQSTVFDPSADDGGILFELTEAAQQLDADELEQHLNRFFNFIDPRVKEAKKEQEIQSIEFVGNTFILNNRTVFKVLSDDGEGHLTIDILKGNQAIQDLKLSSHGLLDGLYVGAIKQVED